MRNARFTALWIAALATWLSLADSISAQSFRRGGTEFNAVRQVTVPAEKPYSAVVVEFLHHGEIHADGRNVAVAAQNKELVPFRILQLGPGDFCRLAFETIKSPSEKGQSEYDIFYGGDPPRDEPPKWTCSDGLLLETRKFRPCNLNNLDSVRKAFDAAEPIGADYVENVFHGYNPCSPRREPFLSRYSGQINIPKDGTYGFITSSQDCSFLLIDDKLVVSAPGRHGPQRHAVRGIRKDLQLSAGRHQFEYYHAAAGNNAVMVAAWEIDPADEKPQKPELIPGEVFLSRLVRHLPAGAVSLRTARQSPDFTAAIAGDVPLPDNDTPLVGVLFRDVSPKSLTMQGAKIEWDFGDGQTSSLPNPDHVYLRPGLYAVKLSIRRGAKSLEATNRIYVDRPPAAPNGKLHTLDEYLRIVENYDPKTLDAASLRQLVLAFEAKSLALAGAAEIAARKSRAAEEDPNRRPGTRNGAAIREKAAADARLSDSDRWLARAIEAGRAAFVERSAVAGGDEELLRLARLIAPMARFRLGDSPAAFEIWSGAAERIAAARAKAECETAAADVAINDLVQPKTARPLLDAAKKLVGQTSESHRVWGDYYAALGDGKSARREYLEAQRTVGNARSMIEQTAWLGARARSTEDFLKAKQYIRAIEELWAWQRDFPSDKLDGYWTLLFARYWEGRGKYAPAIAQAEQLQTVAPDSPYMDQLLYASARCELYRGRRDRALATLESLVKGYPGSPLIPAAQKAIATLKGEKKD